MIKNETTNEEEDLEIIDSKKMAKFWLACKIEEHHLYTGEYDSKRYYKYNSDHEVSQLMKKKKAELVELYEKVYDQYGQQLSRHEINW